MVWEHRLLLYRRQPWQQYKPVHSYNCLGTACHQIAFGNKSTHYKRLLAFPGDPFQELYNLNSFFGPSRNAYKTIALLQKPGKHQGYPYRMRPYKTLCRGHMTLAFVEEMVSPVHFSEFWKAQYRSGATQSCSQHTQPGRSDLPGSTRSDPAGVASNFQAT